VNTATITPDQVERFWSKVDKTSGQGPEGTCWIWTAGKKSSDGYGGFYLSQTDNSIGTHKLSFLLAHNFGLDDLPADIVVRHRCHNPPCVNPDHLMLGTYADNSRDMTEAGRSVSGEKNNKAKLDVGRVRLLRQDWVTGEWTQGELATRYDITQGAVYQIVWNKTWKDPDYTPPDITHRRKFGEDLVDRVRQLRGENKSAKDISAETGIGISQVYNIIGGRQRKAVAV
jgi:hypothetical protein